MNPAAGSAAGTANAQQQPDIVGDTPAATDEDDDNRDSLFGDDQEMVDLQLDAEQQQTFPVSTLACDTPVATDDDDLDSLFSDDEEAVEATPSVEQQQVVSGVTLATEEDLMAAWDEDEEL